VNACEHAVAGELRSDRGEDSIAELCRKEGINRNLYYRWSNEFLEAGKKRLAADVAREATSDSETPPSQATKEHPLRSVLYSYRTVTGSSKPGLLPIEEPAVIERILEHLGGDGEPADPTNPSRAPPQRHSSGRRASSGRSSIALWCGAGLTSGAVLWSIFAEAIYALQESRSAPKESTCSSVDSFCPAQPLFL
jgi:hypothetical protein